MRLADFVELAEMGGVHVWFKMDGLRTRRRWTVILSSAQYDLRCRADTDRLDQALKAARTTLAELPGDWSWMDDQVEDVDDVAEFYEERGDAGEVIILDRPDMLR